MLRREVLSLPAALVFLLSSGVAIAQETAQPAAAASAEERTEEIVVTGTRIRRKDLTTPAPVTVISKETIQASGKVSLGDFLQSLPEQGNAVNTQVNNGGSGAVRVDLRGLGNAQRTLVLVNGRRMIATGTGLQTGQGVDLNTIPTAAVERIEVLKDGASAVYGSDAIGGVVNIITKKGYAASELNAYAGTSSRSDGEVYDVNVTTGTKGERGSVLFSAGYTEQKPVFAGDRDFSLFQLAYDFSTGEVIRIGSSRSPSGRIFDAGRWQQFFPGPDGELGTADDVPNPDAQPGNSLYQQLLTAGSSFTYDPSNPSFGDYRPFDGSEVAPVGDLYNFQPINYNQTPNTRISLFSVGDAQLGSGVRAFFEGSYVNRSSAQQLAPEPLIIGTGGAPVIVSSQNHYNPFGRDFDNVTMRMTSVGPRIQEQDIDTFRVVTGLDGALPESLGPLAGWAWDASLNYGRTVGNWVYRGNLIASRLQQAVGPSFADVDGAHCGTPGNVIASCVPLDLFHGSANVTPEMVNFISFTGPNRITNAMTSFQVNTSGELFALMADRPVGLALGYEFRHESGAFIPDPINQKGDGTGGATDETSGSFDVNEGYAELSLPIVSGMPFAEDLEASVAARVFNYSSFGSDVTYKFGARWRIVPDVTVRGTFSTAFRAPSITDLFLGASDNFPNASDPCAGPGIDPASPLGQACGAAVNNGDDSTQLRSTNSGNPALEPETADIFTAGIVLEPRWVKNLSATVDFYRIKIDSSISTYGVPFILNQCYVGGLQSFCALVDRDASQRVTNVDDINVNVGGDDTQGIDFALRYALPTPYGRFGFAFDGTYLLKFERTIAGGIVIDGRGNFDLGNLVGGTGGIYPKFKFLSGLNWGFGGFGAGATLRYIGSLTECADADGTNFGGLCSDNPTGFSREVSPYYLWDAFVSYNFKNPVGSTNVAVGVRNLFDQAPPVIFNAFTPTSDPTAYDFMGRFFYGTVSHKF